MTVTGIRWDGAESLDLEEEFAGTQAALEVVAPIVESSGLIRFER